MIDTVPIVIAGREMQLCLDIGAMRQAERIVPGLHLLHPGEEGGWSIVSKSADALLAIVWGCLRHEDPRPSMEWLEDHLGPKDVKRLQARITMLFGLSMLAGDEEGGTADPFVEVLASLGIGSGRSPSTTSGSDRPSSGTAPSPGSSSSPAATATPRTAPTTAPE